MTDDRDKRQSNFADGLHRTVTFYSSVGGSTPAAVGGFVTADTLGGAGGMAAAALGPFERKAAAERQATTQGNRQSGAGKIPGPEKGRSADKVAAAVGMPAPSLATVPRQFVRR